MASDRHQKCYVLLWPVSRKWNILCIMFKMGPTSGARTAYPSGAPKFAVLSVLLSFGHCVVCPSVFWPLCCLSFSLLAIVLSVLFRFMDSDYPFGIFKLVLQQWWSHSCEGWHFFRTRKTLAWWHITIGGCAISYFSTILQA